MRPSFETSWGPRHGVSASGRIAGVSRRWGRQPRLPGIAGAVAYDAEGCIEVILDWKCDVDIDAKTVKFLSWAARRPSAAHWRITWLFGADDAWKGHHRLSRRRAVR